MGYLRPVDSGGKISTFWAHLHRGTPSAEPGVDYYTGRGTPVRAASEGWVADVGGGIEPATGRYVTIDLDDGRRVRYLHLSEQWVRAGQHVNRGDVVGLSGASGYGSEWFGADPNDAASMRNMILETGGPHVHTTLWPGHYYAFNNGHSQNYTGTLDLEAYATDTPSGDIAGGGGTEEDDMFDEADRNRQKNIENLLIVAGQGYGYPQLTDQKVTDIQGRVLPSGQPYDNFQLIISLLGQVLNASTPSDVDVPRLLDQMEQRLRANFDSTLQTRLGEYNVAIRADLITALAEHGLSQEDADDLLAAAFGKAQAALAS